jgi:hypothetical protein
MTEVRTMDPTASLFAAYRAQYDYFNCALFGGALCPVILNFSRKAKSLGFFAPLRWVRGESTAHEISLNPSYFATSTARDVASTLVHEMAHCWQMEHGHFGRRGYHNEEWAAKMESIGLMPSSTAAPGGARVGYRMSHYIIEGGAFARAFDAMPAECAFPWVCTEVEGAVAKPKRPPSKVKFSCPECNANAWGKPSLRIVCEDCEFSMVAEGGDGDGDRASSTIVAELRWAA